MTRETFKYRPSLYSPSDLQDVFVGRDTIIKRLLNAIHQAGNQKGISSYLLVGPRGIGKTHLLLLVHHSVRGELHWQGIPDDLHQNWISVLFPEESYGISSLAELLLEVLTTVQDTAYGPEREKLETLIDQCNQALAPGKTERERLIDCLAQTHKRTGKRFLFLIDNLQMVLGRLSNEDQGRLRDLLMRGEWLMLIGAAPTLFEAVTNYEKAFYNLFETVWLHEITLDQIETLIKERLTLDGREALIENFESTRHRLQAVFHLAGGNPRLVLSLYQIFAKAEILEVEHAFLTLLDELTPYFQDRIGGLSPQQQKVLDALALMDGPSTPTQLAKAARLKVNVTTTQLGRLEKDGYLKSQKEIGQKETLYDIRERMFRLWRQMSVEAGRRRLHVIVKFLEAWFTPGVLHAEQGKLTQGLKETEKAYQLALKQQDRDLINLTAQQAFSISLNLSKKNAQRSNLQRALAYFKGAVAYHANIPSKQLLTHLGSFLNDLVKIKNAQLLKQCLELISEIGSEALTEFVKPYQAALLYHQSHDKKILNHLFPEVREIVEEMVAFLEDNQEKPKRRKRKK